MQRSPDEKERRRRHQCDRRLRLKRAVLDAYGGHCQCCGEREIAFLSLDHARDDGATHRAELGIKGASDLYRILHNSGYPQDLGLRVLCHNCNMGRSVNGGICPHKLLSSRLHPGNRRLLSQAEVDYIRAQRQEGPGRKRTGSARVPVIRLAQQFHLSPSVIRKVQLGEKTRHYSPEVRWSGPVEQAGA